MYICPSQVVCRSNSQSKVHRGHLVHFTHVASFVNKKDYILDDEGWYLDQYITAPVTVYSTFLQLA